MEFMVQPTQSVQTGWVFIFPLLIALNNYDIV